MYFDALLSRTGVVLFNGTPEETKKFIRENGPSLANDCYVVDGATLKTFSIGDYLSK